VLVTVLPLLLSGWHRYCQSAAQLASVTAGMSHAVRQSAYVNAHTILDCSHFACCIVLSCAMHPSNSLGAGRTAKTIECGHNHCCVIDNSDSVLCWGTNNYGKHHNTSLLHPLIDIVCEESDKIRCFTPAMLDNVWSPHANRPTWYRQY
jgi:Regulator of chromosome condensation (RCC1) repeat